MLFLMCTGNGSAGMCEPVTQERKQNMYNTKSINESYIFRSIRKAAEISVIGDTNEGLSLTIAIETNNQNNDLSSIYALKSHIISSNLNINEVYSDQQTLCKTEVLYSPITHYRCLYIIKYNKNDINNHLLINPVLEDETRDYIMFANFIDRELYDLYKTTPLESSIPSVKNYAKMTDKEDFLYIDLNFILIQQRF